MNEKLKPCPFCGKSVAIEETEAGDYLIRCECGLHLLENMRWDGSEPGNLIETWNTRQSPPPWETLQQWEARMDEWYPDKAPHKYPDDGPVWSSEGPFDWEKMEGHFWNLVEYRDIKLNKSNGFAVVIATSGHGKPKPDWRPE